MSLPPSPSCARKAPTGSRALSSESTAERMSSPKSFTPPSLCADSGRGGKAHGCTPIAMVGIDLMVYAGIVIGLLVVGVLLRYLLWPPIPRSITSLADAERVVNYHIEAANRRLRRHAWMLTF